MYTCVHLIASIVLNHDVFHRVMKCVVLLNIWVVRIVDAVQILKVQV